MIVEEAAETADGTLRYFVRGALVGWGNANKFLTLGGDAAATDSVGSADTPTVEPEAAATLFAGVASLAAIRSAFNSMERAKSNTGKSQLDPTRAQIVAQGFFLWGICSSASAAIGGDGDDNGATPAITSKTLPAKSIASILARVSVRHCISQPTSAAWASADDEVPQPNPVLDGDGDGDSDGDGDGNGQGAGSVAQLASAARQEAAVGLLSAEATESSAAEAAAMAEAAVGETMASGDMDAVRQALANLSTCQADLVTAQSKKAEAATADASACLAEEEAMVNLASAAAAAATASDVGQDGGNDSDAKSTEEGEPPSPALWLGLWPEEQQWESWLEQTCLASFRRRLSSTTTPQSARDDTALSCHSFIDWLSAATSDGARTLLPWLGVLAGPRLQADVSNPRAVVMPARLGGASELLHPAAVYLLSQTLPAEWSTIRGGGGRQGRGWRRLFKMSTDGRSFARLKHALSGQGPTLLICRDMTGAVFGGFASEDWGQAAAAAKADSGQRQAWGEQSFVFSLTPALAVYRPPPVPSVQQFDRAENPKRFLHLGVIPSRGFDALPVSQLGFGSGVGGSDSVLEGPRLGLGWLGEPELRYGVCHRCESFDAPPLSTAGEWESLTEQFNCSLCWHHLAILVCGLLGADDCADYRRGRRWTV